MVNLGRVIRQNATMSMSIDTIVSMLGAIPAPSAGQVMALSAAAAFDKALEEVTTEAHEATYGTEGPEEGPGDI